MGAIEQILSQPWSQRLGWSLLHFGWQGFVIAALLGVAMTALRRRSANLRYALACAALVVMVAAPVVTFFAIDGSTRDGTAGPAEQVAVDVAMAEGERTLSATELGPSDGPALNWVPDEAPAGTVSPSAPPIGAPDADHQATSATLGWVARVSRFVRPALPPMVIAWVAGVTALAIWHVGGWVGLVRLRRSALPLGQAGSEARCARAATRLINQLGLSRPIRLLKSARIAGPVAVGILRPAVLMPVTMLTGLSAAHIEAILAHEIAHLRRYDCLVNLLQSLVETVLFYHPTVWWVSGRIRAERENCCDDVAVGICGDPKGYVQALAKLAEPGAGRNPAFAAAATGGKLLSRIRRLLRTERPGPLSFGKCLSGMLALTALIAIGITLGISCAADEVPAAQPSIAADQIPATQPSIAADQTPVTQPSIAAGQTLATEAKPREPIFLGTYSPSLRIVTDPARTPPHIRLLAWTDSDDPDRQRAYLDLDSGRYLPGYVNEWDRLKDSLVRQGVDLRLRVEDGQIEIVAVHMQLARIVFLDGISAEGLRQVDLSAFPLDLALTFLDRTSPQEQQVLEHVLTYFFRTAEGSIGVIRLGDLGGTEPPARSVEYRILQPAESTAAASEDRAIPSSTVSATTQAAVNAPATRLAQLSREMLRQRLGGYVQNALRLNRPSRRMTDPNNVDAVLADAAGAGRVSLIRLATARLLEWSDQPKVLARMAELAQSRDPIVKLRATAVLACQGREENVEFLLDIASGARVLTSSGFERDIAAWTLLAMGKTLPRPVNSHSEYFNPVLKEIRTLQQSGREVSPAVLIRLEDEIFLLAASAATRVRWTLNTKPRKRGRTLRVNVTRSEPGSVFSEYQLYPSPWTVESAARWNAASTSVHYVAIASNSRCTLMLTGEEDKELSDKIIQALALRRLSEDEGAHPPATQPEAGKEAFEQEMALANASDNGPEKVAHARKALRLAKADVDKLRAEYQLAVAIIGAVRNPTLQRSEMAEGTEMLRRIALRKDAMDYYSRRGADSPHDPGLLIPAAAVKAAQQMEDPAEGKRLYLVALDWLRRTHERRVQDWLAEPKPTKPPAGLRGPMEMSKWESRVRMWEQRKQRAKDGKVLSVPETHLIPLAVNGYIERHEPSDRLAAMEQLRKEFAGTEIMAAVDAASAPAQPATQAAGTARESPLEADKLAKSHAKRAMDLAQTGGDPHELAEAVRKALEFEHDDPVAAQLYVYLGDAYQRQTGRRRLAAEAYLTGLQRVLRTDLPTASPQRGFVDGFILAMPRGTVRAYPTKAQREMASGRGTKLLEKLVKLRQILTSQVVQTYATQPDAFDELTALVREHLNSDQAAEQMVEAALARRVSYKAPVPVIASPPRGGRPEQNPAESARFMSDYDTRGVEIEAGFIPDRTRIIQGQPLFITFVVINRSDRPWPYEFNVGGDNRGSVRHNSFRITAADADGRAVRDPYSYNNFGGHGGNVMLEPGHAYMERLYLGYWCAFEKPGLYTVSCKRMLPHSSPGPRSSVVERRIVPVVTSFDLTIAPSDAETLGKIIADLGRRVRDGHAQALYEATLGLSEIHDERVIPHLAMSLARGDGRNKRLAVRGLGRFDVPAAADALLIALEDPDHAVRRAAGEALKATGHTDRVIDALLEELTNDNLHTRALAARGLGDSRSERAFDPLVAALADAAPAVNHAAAEAIGALGDPRGIEVLRLHVTSEDMAMRVAAAKGLLALKQPLDPQWLTPVILRTGPLDDRSFHESIRLIRLHGGDQAAPALVSCLKSDDPSPNAYNMYLIGAIEASRGGPKYYYKFHSDPNPPVNPLHLDENRKILDELRAWLAEHRRSEPKPVETAPQ